MAKITNGDRDRAEFLDEVIKTLEPVLEWNLTEQAERTINGWVDAWRDADWAAMVKFSQKHWVAGLGRRAAMKHFQDNFKLFLPCAVTGSLLMIEEEAGLNREVMRDYVVHIELCGGAPPVVKAQLIFRIIRERRFDSRPFYWRWWMRVKAKVKRVAYVPLPDPDVKGDWGVNPISVLRRKK